MATEQLYPLTFAPLLKEVIWGGSDIRPFKGLEPDDKKIFHLRWGEHTGYDWIQVWHIMENGETGYLYRHSKQIYRRREVILDTLAKFLYM